MPVPADAEITVVEQSRKHTYVVIPVKEELSEEELAGAAGGSDPFSVLFGITYGKGC